MSVCDRATLRLQCLRALCLGPGWQSPGVVSKVPSPHSGRFYSCPSPSVLPDRSHVCAASCLRDQEGAWGRGRIGWWEEGAPGVRCLSPLLAGPGQEQLQEEEEPLPEPPGSSRNDSILEEDVEKNAEGMASLASWLSGPGTGRWSGHRV